MNLSIILLIIVGIIGIISLFWPIEQHKTPPIFKPLYDYSVLGSHDTATNIICINPELDNYPVLKERVIAHELGHTKDKNTFMVLIREIKDYSFIHSTEEFELYKKEVIKLKRPNTSFMHSIAGAFYVLILPFIYIYSLIIIFFIKGARWLKQQ